MDMPNAIKSVLADVLSVSPSSEQRQSKDGWIDGWWIYAGVKLDSVFFFSFFQAEKMFQEVRRLEPNKLEGNVAVV